MLNVVLPINYKTYCEQVIADLMNSATSIEWTKNVGECVYGITRLKKLTFIGGCIYYLIQELKMDLDYSYATLST